MPGFRCPQALRAPQVPQVRGSASSVFRTRHADVLRASLDISELSRSQAGMPGTGLLARAGARGNLPRLK